MRYEQWKNGILRTTPFPDMINEFEPSFKHLYDSAFNIGWSERSDEIHNIWRKHKKSKETKIEPESLKLIFE